MIFTPALPFILLLLLLIALAVLAVYCAVHDHLRKTKNFRRISIFVLLIIALMRPAIGTSEVDRELSNLNIFFVVDNTGSMVTRDMDSNSKYRYEKVAEDIKELIKLFPGSKYSIITLDYNVYQAMPLINNADTAIAYIDTLSPKNSEISSDSDLTRLLRYAYERVDNYTKHFPERTNILFLFSDGEDIGKKTIAPDVFSTVLAGGAVIGYGTTTGAAVHRVDYNNEPTTYTITDPATGNQHISKLDEENLKSIAKSLMIPYYRRTSSNDKFAKRENFMTSMGEYRRDGKNMKVQKDLYWIPMIIAVVLLLVDLLRILESLLLERKAAK